MVLFQNWRAIVGLMGKLGKQSIKRRIAEFQVSDLKIEVAQQAKVHNIKYTAEEVRNVSAGCGSFFVWVSFNALFYMRHCNSEISWWEYLCCVTMFPKVLGSVFTAGYVKKRLVNSSFQAIPLSTH